MNLVQAFLAKLVHLQGRINKQFGFEEFDQPEAPNRLSKIVDNFKDGINISVYKFDNQDNCIAESVDPVRRERLDQIVTFTRNKFKDIDIAQYTPGFFGKLGRWFMSLFRTASHYLNDTSEKQAWASVVSDITYTVVPEYIQNGSEYFEKSFPQSGLKKRVDRRLDLRRIAKDNVKSIASKFFELKGVVNDLFSAVDNPLKSPNNMMPDQITQTAQNVVLLLSPYYIKQKFFVEPAEITGIKQNVHVPYQVDWPSESISKLNPADLKKYAEQLGGCIRAVLASGDHASNKINSGKVI